jgi:uncharacterized protein YoxC
MITTIKMFRESLDNPLDVRMKALAKIGRQVTLVYKASEAYETLRDADQVDDVSDLLDRVDALAEKVGGVIEEVIAPYEQKGTLTEEYFELASDGIGQLSNGFRYLTASLKAVAHRLPQEAHPDVWKNWFTSFNRHLTVKLDEIEKTAEKISKDLTSLTGTQETGDGNDD